MIRMKDSTLTKLGLAALAASLAFVAGPTRAKADEGMWPFNMVPKDAIQKDHKIAITDAWLDHVRLSSVRFNSGGSGSFVSPTGLVLTNHHVGTDCIAKIATSAHDWLELGYIAGKDGPEVKCPDLELNVLLKIEDVTAEVKAVKKPGMTDADANVAIKGKMSEIEKLCSEKTGSRCDVVTLYAGGQYNLYTYKKHTDVRLVFAPEQAIAFFGGDPDNFTYPRFDLDMALFRVYENDKPFVSKDFLKWNESGPKDGEVAFVSGHPGSTGRMATYSQLLRLRDTVYPYSLDRLTKQRAALLAVAKEGVEPAREVKKPMFSIENGFKAITGFQGGLKDPKLMAKKQVDETLLKKNILEKPELAAAYGKVFDDVDKTQVKLGEMYKRYAGLEGAVDSSILAIARDLVRLPVETELPNEKRLREYRSSNLDSLKMHLMSPAPVYGAVEVALMTTWLERIVRDLGPNDPVVKKILAGRTPARAARETIALSKLSDVYTRKKLLDGGKAAILESQDPAIHVILALDPEARAIRKRYDDEIEGPMRAAGQKIAEAVFAVHGASVPPDATFTLRLSVGVVQGYSEGGKSIPWATSFGGLKSHATGKEPLKLPPRWVEKWSTIKEPVSFNFVSTNDIIGGNSGSPVINANGEIVGLIFDGNISSLANRFVYGETTQRAVSVDTAGMLEALTHIYGADAVVKELLGK
ncbi:MAG: Peptidase [Myxococcaceae bacterium]|nr:Peptidase [Myxococcaceae bacterium]